MGKTLGELADLAREAWMQCDLTGDHWAATASAVRKAVLEEAIEAVRALDFNSTFSTESLSVDFAIEHFGDGAETAINEAIKTLQRLIGEKNEKERES